MGIMGWGIGIGKVIGGIGIGGGRGAIIGAGQGGRGHPVCGTGSTARDTGLAATSLGEIRLNG